MSVPIAEAEGTVKIFAESNGSDLAAPGFPYRPIVDLCTVVVLLLGHVAALRNEVDNLQAFASTHRHNEWDGAPRDVR